MDQTEYKVGITMKRPIKATDNRDIKKFDIKEWQTKTLNEFNTEYTGKGGLKKFQTYIDRRIGAEFGISDSGFLKKIGALVAKQSQKEIKKKMPDWWNGTGSYADEPSSGVNYVDKSKAGHGRRWLTEGRLNEGAGIDIEKAFKKVEREVEVYTGELSSRNPKWIDDKDFYKKNKKEVDNLLTRWKTAKNLMAGVVKQIESLSMKAFKQEK